TIALSALRPWRLVDREKRFPTTRQRSRAQYRISATTIVAFRRKQPPRIGPATSVCQPRSPVCIFDSISFIAAAASDHAQEPPAASSATKAFVTISTTMPTFAVSWAKRALRGEFAALAIVSIPDPLDDQKFTLLAIFRKHACTPCSAQCD